MKTITLVVLFLVVNFAALGIGGIFTGAGVPSDWYQSLNQAPWTPPGGVFGVAWTTIMICFAVFMAVIWRRTPVRRTLIQIYILQWILNVGWNPVFFHFHLVLPGFIVIVALTGLVGYLFFKYLSLLRAASLWILPYLLWMLVATSLNGYILLYNQ